MKNSTALEVASLRKTHIQINSNINLKSWQVIQIKELHQILAPSHFVILKQQNKLLYTEKLLLQYPKRAYFYYRELSSLIS